MLSGSGSHPIFDTSVDWACGASTSVYLILDPIIKNSRQIKECADRFRLHNFSDFHLSECVVAVGGGAITYPDNLSNWTTHESAVVMGTIPSYNQSVIENYSLRLDQPYSH